MIFSKFKKDPHCSLVIKKSKFRLLHSREQVFNLKNVSNDNLNLNQSLFSRLVSSYNCLFIVIVPGFFFNTERKYFSSKEISLNGFWNSSKNISIYLGENPKTCKAFDSK